MDYQYEEFPLWVEHEKGERRIVDSQEDFDALGDGWKKPAAHIAPGFGPGRAFQEYPKFVNGVIVQNEEEEAALAPTLEQMCDDILKREDRSSGDGAEDGPDEQDEKAAALALAEERGVKVDKRWNAEKIRAAIADSVSK